LASPSVISRTPHLSAEPKAGMAPAMEDHKIMIIMVALNATIILFDSQSNCIIQFRSC
jgi:hypothetical protein